MNTLALGYSSYAERTRLSLTGDMLVLARTWFGRARQRRQLNQLSDWQLDDLGISRSDARREATKPFWRS